MLRQFNQLGVHPPFRQHCAKCDCLGTSDSTAPGRVVFVAINRSNVAKVTAISGQALSDTAHLYQMTATSASGQSVSVVQPVSIGTMAVGGSSLTITLPAYSVTTIDVH
jgi:hypothetical protein